MKNQKQKLKALEAEYKKMGQRIQQLKDKKSYELAYPVDYIDMVVVEWTGKASKIVVGDSNTWDRPFAQGRIEPTLKLAERQCDYNALNMRIEQFIENNTARYLDFSDMSTERYYLSYCHLGKNIYLCKSGFIQSKPTKHHFHKDVYPLLKEAFTEEELVNWCTFCELT